MTRRIRTLVGCVAAATMTATMSLAFGGGAQAFKPYTHTQTGYAAMADALDDGHVTIAGSSYAVPPRVVQALQQFPAHYNAGVIGPDGFPDLTMGQSVVHPENTGQWLAFLLDAAWDAQQPGAGPAGGPAYSEDEKLQILAFTYGYLTHGAGDSWAHTMVNELSEGIFPGVGEILTDSDMAAIALRHLLIEGYIGAATTGYDNDPNEELLAGGDVSDDSTAGIAFAAPGRFINDTLVRRGNGSPADDRGPVLDFFYGLRGSLDTFLTTTPDPLGEAIEGFNEVKAGIESKFAPAKCDGIDNDGDGDVDEGCSPPLFIGDEDNSGPCSFGAGDVGVGIAADIATDIVECPIALGVEIAIETGEAALEVSGQLILAALKPVLDAYVYEWIQDIDAGLASWHELGLATTNALFNPQTRRDAQNDICDSYGPDVVTAENHDDETNSRRVCENGVGVVDTVLWASDDFINDHLLSMLGTPDAIGDLREVLADISDELDDILGPVLNPLRTLSNEIHEFASDLVKDALSERFGIDVELIESLLSDPTTRLDIEQVNLGTLGAINVLGPDVRAILDGYLGLDSHDPFEPLASGEVFSPGEFAVYDNTTTLAKLLLLDGASLDQLLSDLVGRPYALYDIGDPRSNIMTTTLPGVPGDASQWLRLIDGDHPWRQDGAPVFAPGDNHGGEGNMPLFESCALRDMGFRTLFDDRENDDGDGVLEPGEDFPDLGDATSFDPNDPLAPESVLTIGSPSVFDPGTTWVSTSTPLGIDASDDFWFPAEIATAISIDGVASTTVTAGAPFTLAPHADGPASIGHQPSDPCRTGVLTTDTVVVDDTPPTVSITAPVADPPPYDTDDLVPVAYSADDGAGVGVDAATFEVYLDGVLVDDAFVIDTYLLDAGLHDLTVAVADRLGNVGTSTVTFRVRATSASLYNNIVRARSEGLIPNNGMYNGGLASLSQAIKSHDKGRHDVEHNQLNAVRNQLSQESPSKTDQELAARLIGYIDDLIAADG